MKLLLALIWCVFVILMTYVLTSMFRKASTEGFTPTDTNITESPKILGVVSYRDKPNHVYIVDMNGGHEYFYDGDRLAPTGNQKFLGTMVPLSLLGNIDAIAVDPTGGNFLHLIFSNADQTIYEYNPKTQEIEHESSYKSHFGDTITNVVAVWQTPFEGPDFEYMFVYDGANTHRLEFRNKFQYNSSRSTIDNRFKVIKDQFDGEIVGATTIWSQNPITDLKRPIVFFGPTHYAVLNSLEQTAGPKLPYLV